MSEAARQLYGWEDYRRWPDDRRWEVIGGEAFAMSPAPTTRHQRVLQELSRQLGNHFAGKTCVVFPAPTDVKLSDTDIVQPDISVVCVPGQIKSTHIEGAPTLVVEILSPSTNLHDRKRKLARYAATGVKEVWIVTPYPGAVEVFVLADGAYRLQVVYGDEDTLRSPTFPRMRIAMRKVFGFPVPPGEAVAVVKEGRPPAYGSRQHVRPRVAGPAAAG